MAAEFLVQPQRPGRGGFEPCEPHKAHSFVVLKVTKQRKGLHTFKSTRFVARYSSLKEAEAMAQAHRLMHGKVSRDYKLGKRMTAQ